MIFSVNLSRIIKFMVFLIPSVILMGWLIQSDYLKHFFNLSSAAMNPMSAVCFILLGTALLTSGFNIDGKRKYLPQIIAVFPLFLSLLHASSWIGDNVRLDQLLFADQLNGNKMPLHTSIGFVIASSTIIFFHVKGIRALTVSPLLALAVGWLSLLAITGHLYGVDVLKTQSSYAPMATSTAITFLFFSVSVLLSKPTYEPTRTFLSPTDSGRIARVLVPLAVCFPIFSAWARMNGERLEIFDPKLGSTIFALINIAVWSTALWVTSYYLYQAEKKNKELTDFLDRNSKTDLLTGLWNRRYLDERLEVEMSAKRRHGRIFSVVICDIDFFKKVNDTYGHPVGDAAIKAMGKILVDTVRKEDVVCRFGGEEFVILLPDTALADATKLAERMRIAVEKMKIETDTVCLNITSSFGVAQVENSSKTIIENADVHLYAAKQAGRNRVVSTLVKTAA